MSLCDSTFSAKVGSILVAMSTRIAECVGNVHWAEKKFSVIPATVASVALLINQSTMNEFSFFAF